MCKQKEDMNPKRNITIIGISGKKKSGKDKTLECIRELLPNHTIVRIAFADALKKEVARALVTTPSYLEEHKDNFRLILQGWGTDYRRALYGEGYWVNLWLQSVNDCVDFDKATNLVIVAPDVRFKNEAECIKKLGGYVVRVNKITDQVNDQHESESQLDTGFEFDYLIINSFHPDSLRHNVNDMLFGLKIIQPVTIPHV